MDKRFLICKNIASVTDEFVLLKTEYSTMPIFRTEDEAVEWIKNNGEQYITYVIVPSYTKF